MNSDYCCNTDNHNNVEYSSIFLDDSTSIDFKSRNSLSFFNFLEVHNDVNNNATRVGIPLDDVIMENITKDGNSRKRKHSMKNAVVPDILDNNSKALQFPLLARVNESPGKPRPRRKRPIKVNDNVDSKSVSLNAICDKRPKAPSLILKEQRDVVLAEIRSLKEQNLNINQNVIEKALECKIFNDVCLVRVRDPGKQINGTCFLCPRTECNRFTTPNRVTRTILQNYFINDLHIPLSQHKKITWCHECGKRYKNQKVLYNAFFPLGITDISKIFFFQQQEKDSEKFSNLICSLCEANFSCVTRLPVKLFGEIDCANCYRNRDFLKINMKI